MLRIALIILTLTGCTSYFNSSRDEGRQTAFVLDELRMEMADLKHTLKATQVELSLLEEKVQANPSDKSDHKLKEINAHLVLLEKKIAQISQVQDRTLSDLRQLSS